jgi:hypothetical protein
MSKYDEVFIVDEPRVALIISNSLLRRSCDANGVIKPEVLKLAQIAATESKVLLIRLDPKAFKPSKGVLPRTHELVKGFL